MALYLGEILLTIALGK